MELSQRVQNLAPSATLAVSAKAAELKAQGVDVVTFAAGEPDFDTPAHVKEAAKKALDQGQTKYAKPASGIPALKAAIVDKFKRENNSTYEPSQILVSVGGKRALHLAFQALIDPGDEVILPVPYWVSYPEQIKLAGGKVVEVRGAEADNFQIAPEQIARAITSKTKALVLNSPSNPGGFMYAPEAIRAIADLLADKDIMVLSDEMYDQLVYGGRTFMSYAAARKEAYEKSLTFCAGSKTYSMTGWRIGYVAGPQPIIKGMAGLQSQTTSGTTTFGMHGLIEALTADQACVQQMRKEFEKRALHMHKRLNELPGVHCVQPAGAFYVFPNVSETYEKLGVKGSVEFCTRVLEDWHVAAVPGVAFGCDENVRLSFATSMEQIDEGLDRLGKLLS